MKLALLLFVLTGCAFPAERFFTGTVTKIERRQNLEAVCPLNARLRDPNACHQPPVCCSYQVRALDSTGHELRFYAFWPDYVAGLTWTENRRVWFHLHRTEIYEFPCTMYGCRTFIDYALKDDTDWRVLE